jgi:hypothetical protein
MRLLRSWSKAKDRTQSVPIASSAFTPWLCSPYAPFAQVKYWPCERLLGSPEASHSTKPSIQLSSAPRVKYPRKKILPITGNSRNWQKFQGYLADYYRVLLPLASNKRFSCTLNTPSRYTLYLENVSKIEPKNNKIAK